MGRFARPANYLRFLFPPTGTPPTQRPSAVRDDVQLVEQYTAGGQIALAETYLLAVSNANPGPGNVQTILDPVTQFGLTEPEVLRLFFVDIQISAGPAAIYSVDLSVQNAGTTAECQIQKGFTIGATDARPTVWDVQGPLILVADPNGTQNVLRATQTSAQAASAETVLYHFLLQRNQRGSTHYL